MNTDKIYWDAAVAFYLFSAGISAGALITSLLAEFLDAEKYRRIARLGALIAPFPISVGIAALIYDLEKPLSFWRLLTTFHMSSVMSIGAWVITLFSVISAVMFFLHLPDRYDLLRIKRLASGKAALRTLRIVGMVVAIGTGVYTGILLCVLAARPLWNTPLLPAVFLASATLDGIAAISLLYFSVSRKADDEDTFEAGRSLLHRLDFTFMMVLCVGVSLLLLYLQQSTADSRNALHLIAGGPLATIFWIGFVGIGVAVPLIYGLSEFLRPTRNYPASGTILPLFSSASVLVGGFVLRFVVVYAGQITEAALR